jgi:hypothetical protein
MGDRTHGVLKRRGLLAGMVALATAGMAKLAGPAEAAHNNTTAYSSESVLHADSVNTTAQSTTIKAESGSTPLIVQNTTTDTPVGPCGVFAATSRENSGGQQGAGVFGLGTGDRGTGAAGLAESQNGVGVYGAAARKFITESATPGSGVFGFGPTNGVAGRSNGAALRGDSTTGFGLYANSQSGVGAFGSSNTGFGVYANSNENTAVFATGARGVWGRATAGIGVLAQATASGTVQNRSFGLYAVAPAPGWAGYFEGNVYVTGQVYTAGGGVLAPAQGSDGTTRALYSLDTAEPVVEDFGEGRLANGRAAVRLDSNFAAVADGSAYHVFLTEGGDYGGLYVPKKDATGFEVRARDSAAAGTFSYRVVARRKGAPGRRLEKLERPRGLDAKDVQPPRRPAAPELPSANRATPADVR